MKQRRLGRLGGQVGEVGYGNWEMGAWTGSAQRRDRMPTSWSQ